MDRKIIFALVVVAILVFSISVYSIISDTIYADAATRLSFRSTDFANSLFGVPYLLTGAWLLYRKRKSWIWIVPGALFYVVYVYLPYVLALEVNQLFLAYILIIAGSLYLLAIVLATRDYPRIEREFSGDCSLRMMVGVMLLLGIFIAIRQSTLSMSAVAEGMQIEMTDVAIWIDDLVLGCPALLFGAYFLHKRKGIGYVIGPAMLLCYAILSIGLMPYFYLESRYLDQAIQWDGVGIIALMITVCLVPIFRYLRCLKKSGRTSG